MKEKERFLNQLDNHFGTLVKQIQIFDALQVDVLTQIDPQIFRKFDLVKANIEVCGHSLCIHVLVWAAVS